jgi:hypothetical protein
MFFPNLHFIFWVVTTDIYSNIYTHTLSLSLSLYFGKLKHSMFWSCPKYVSENMRIFVYMKVLHLMWMISTNCRKKTLSCLLLCCSHLFYYEIHCCQYCGVFTSCKNCNLEPRSRDYATVDKAVFSPCLALPCRAESCLACCAKREL